MSATIIKKKIKANNRHWKNFLDKDYLGSHNLEKGEEMLVTIAKFIGEEEVCTADGKKSDKVVLYFKEGVPKMIMNITNGNTITNLYGSTPETWIGKQIQIYATPVKAFGKTQDALRIRDFIPNIEIDLLLFVDELKKATTLEELKTIWISFPVSARNDSDLLKAKNELKELLTK